MSSDDFLKTKKWHPQFEAADVISHLVKTIEVKISSVASADVGGSRGAFHSIFRVPRNLRQVDAMAYKPQIVSIGPYHHGEVSLRKMEMHKCRILSHVLDRTGLQVGTCLEALMPLEDDARRSYAEPVSRMETPEFIEMMLLDACFVIELLRAASRGFEEGNPIFGIRSLVPYIQRDLVMVENQLPFFVIERLFVLTSETDEVTWLPNLALMFFDSLIHGIVRNNVWNLTQVSPHLLALVHYSLCQPQSSSGQYGHGTADSSSLHMVHSVTRLRACGVIFQKKMASNNFMDVEFERRNGVLKIPPLLSSKTFLNLMAFEQDWPSCRNRVTSYLCFMGNLINTSQDVRHLRHEGIIDHGLGSEEHVAHLFNDLRAELSVDLYDLCLTELAENLNRYAEKKRHGWMASLKHEYFRNPWAIIGLTVGFMVFVLSFTQTFYTVFPYYYPRSR